MTCSLSASSLPSSVNPDVFTGSIGVSSFSLPVTLRCMHPGRKGRLNTMAGGRDSTLAFLGPIPDITSGRLVVDDPLANRVRSGRKQP